MIEVISETEACFLEKISKTGEQQTKLTKEKKLSYLVTIVQRDLSTYLTDSYTQNTTPITTKLTVVTGSVWKLSKKKEVTPCH